MLALKSLLPKSKKQFSKRNYSSFSFNLIKLGLIAFFGMTFYSCKSTTAVKNYTNNAAIEKIASLTKDNILVCAHRSFHTNAPENSLQSIKNAIKAKIDIIEIDVRTSKDSILVLMHDDNIDRITTGKGFIKDYTYAELLQFNLKMGDSTTNEKIPMLEDALKLSKGKLIVNLDLKAVNYKQLYQMLKRYKMEHEVISFIGKKKKIQEMISIDSLYAVMPLSGTKEDISYYEKTAKSGLQHFTDESFTLENMNWTRTKGILVFVNTLWDEDDSFILGKMEAMDRVIALKPSIIQTDHPQLLVNYLRTKKLHK